jgi:hypothetical protein
VLPVVQVVVIVGGRSSHAMAGRSERAFLFPGTGDVSAIAPRRPVASPRPRNEGAEIARQIPMQIYRYATIPRRL